MPRRRPRPLPPAPSHPLARLAPMDRAAALDEVEAVVGATLAALTRSPLHAPLGPPDRQRLRGRWHAELPAVARDLADLLEGEAPLLAGLRVAGEDLRAGEEETQRLAALKARLDLLSDWVADLLLVSRADLYDRAGRVLRAVAALPEAGLLPEEDVRRVQSRAAPAAARLARRNAAIQQKKRARAALRGAQRPLLQAPSE